MIKATPSLSSPNPLWAAFPATSAIKCWAADVGAAAREQAHANTWAEIDQAVLITHHDTAETESLMTAIAAAAGVRLVIVDVDGAKTDLDAIVGEQPVMVFLRPGEWLGGNLDDGSELFGRPRHPDFDQRAGYDFRRRLQSGLEGEWKGAGVILVTTVEAPEQIERALRGPGLFDCKIGLPALAPEIHAELFIAQVGAHHFDADVRANPRRLGLIVRDVFDTMRTRGLVAKCLLRGARRKGQAISFGDITEAVIYGDQSRDDPLPFGEEEARRVAIHEAGYALVAYADSLDHAIPAYCTVIPHGDALGLICHAPDAHNQTARVRTVRDARHDIRVNLAGRAAEVLLLGMEMMAAAGSFDDLTNASDLAIGLVSSCGVPLSESDAPGSNLLVCEADSAPESQRVNAAARACLEKEFATVTALLEENITALEALVAELLAKKVLVADDMRKILSVVTCGESRVVSAVPGDTEWEGRLAA